MVIYVFNFGIDPEKNIPSTQANATSLVAKLTSSLSIHFLAHLAFSATHGIVSMALNNYLT